MITDPKPEAPPATSASGVGGPKLLHTDISRLPMAAVVFKRDGTIVEVNAPLLSLFEAETPNELMGKNIFKLITVDSDDCRCLIADQNAAQGRQSEIDFVTLRASPRRARILTIPLISADGRLKRFLALARDITSAATLNTPATSWRPSLNRPTTPSSGLPRWPDHDLEQGGGEVDRIRGG